MSRHKFVSTLAAEYEVLFKEPAYAHAAKKYTPHAMAEAMTDGLLNKTACKNGKGIKAACKKLGIKNTYKEIGEFIRNGDDK